MTTRNSEKGTTLVELLVAMVITLFIVSAAGYIYLGTRETQKAIDQNSSSIEVGTFAMQLIGHDILNAGFYPSTMPPINAANPLFATMRNASTYPPAQGIPVRATDWVSPAPVYNFFIFGCEGAKFDHVTATCGTTVTGAPDSIVINYFTNEAESMGAVTGQRRDCTGADVKNDPSNAVRQLNTPVPNSTTVNVELPPQAPLFASNRYGLNTTTLQIEGKKVTTQSLACSGNGNTKFGIANTAAYQPILAGVDDLQFTYGIFNTEDTRAPDRFYNATEVASLATVKIDGVDLEPWARVSAVRVCIMTSTLAGSQKIADKAGALRTYVDCNDQTITQAASDPSLKKRQIQVFGVRNRLNQGF